MGEAKDKVVTNTAAVANETPGVMLMMLLTGGGLTGGISGGIERVEADGQSELVASEQIPTDVRECDDAELERLGFTLGAPTPGDPLFRSATLPAGWRKEATDHSMWSRVVDGQGVERFEIFYKAAPYDRAAFMRPSP